MKRLLILSILLLLLPLASADSCDSAKNPDLCYYIQAKETSNPSLCDKINAVSLKSSCKSQLETPTTNQTPGNFSLEIIILILIIIFVIGLILAFYWMWHKSHITKSNLIKNVKYPQLLSYIQKAKKKGLTKRKIKQTLKQEGWPKEIIDQYL